MVPALLATPEQLRQLFYNRQTKIDKQNKETVLRRNQKMNPAELTLPTKSVSSDAVVAPIAWWSDYAALTKPRILLMILFTVGMGMVAFAHRELSFWIALHTLIGTAFIAASASVLNQWLEQDRDALMPRTQNRPLPSGRLTSFEAAFFGWSTAAIGFAYLIAFTNLNATLVGLATWVAYVWIYTPMKLVTWWNTAVGTLPGALPVMIGWTAAGGGIDSIYGWVLTSVVILWQFPHFMSIAWLYRDQYDRAGYRMLTNEQPSGIAAGWHAVVPALALIPVSVWAVLPNSPLTGCLALFGVLSCLVQLNASIRFLANRNEQTARKLLHSSLLYLPSIMLVVVIRSCI